MHALLDRLGLGDLRQRLRRKVDKQSFVSLSPHLSEAKHGPESGSAAIDVEVRIVPSYFDEAYYLANNDDARRSGADAFAHYLRHGDIGLRAPSVYFDPQHYLSQVHDSLLPSEGPFAHYIRIGSSQRISPSPYFDAKWYANQIPNNEDVPDLLEHYLAEGWKLDLSPSPYFDVRWYLSSYYDVAASNIEPLWHYLNFGVHEGRFPNPYFDPTFYLEHNKDVRESRLEPLFHYLTWGWRELHRRPNPFFDPGWYMNIFLPGSVGVLDPLRHYIEMGRDVNSSPSPDFDPEFYAQQTPEVGSNVHRYKHFLHYGRHAGRRPNRRVPEVARPDVIGWAKENRLRLETVRDLHGRVGSAPIAVSVGREAEVALRAVIDDIDVVSFDVFDTLIERACGTPEAVFELVGARAAALGCPGSDFVTARKDAEAKARERHGIQEVSLQQIYEDFRILTGCNPSVSAELAAVELEEERRVCQARPLGKLLFDLALSEKKTVVLASDIYLPEEFVDELVRRCGYSGYAKLYVSSELGCTKHYGTMFTYILADLGLDARRVLHIGDNPHSDGEMAQKAGLGALLLSNRWRSASDERVATQTYPRSAKALWRHLAAASSTTESAKTLFVANRLSGPESVYLSTGIRVLGPLLLTLGVFFAQRALIGRYEKLFFASRDGFYLKEAYDIVRRFIQNSPPSQYFAASRKVCRYAMLYQHSDIVDLAGVDHGSMTIQQFLSGRYMVRAETARSIEGITPAMLDHVVTDAPRDGTLLSALRLASDCILSGAEEHRSAYVQYLTSLGLLDQRSAVVDVGYRGTVQLAVSKLTGTRVGGLYFMTWPEIDQTLSAGLRFDTFLRLDKRAPDIINRNLPILELLLSGTHQSVSHFTSVNGQPTLHFLPVDTDPRTRQTLNAARRGALCFVRQMCETYGSRLFDFVPDEDYVCGLLRDLLQSPPFALVSGLREHVSEDDFGGVTRPLLVAPQAGLSLTEALQRSSWREGTARLWRAERHGFACEMNGDETSLPDRFDGRSSQSGLTVDG